MEKCQTSSYLSWGKLTPKCQTFKYLLQHSNGLVLLTWSRQGNNGTPLLHPLPFCVPTIWNPAHLSIKLHTVAHEHFQDFSILIVTWTGLKEQHFWCGNMQSYSLSPCREMRAMNEMGTGSRKHKMLTLIFHCYSVPPHILQCPLTYITITCDALIYCPNTDTPFVLRTSCSQ